MFKKSLIALAMGGFCIGMTEFVIMGLLPDLAQYLNTSEPKVAYLIVSYAIGVVVGAPLMVLISSKYAPKKILIILMIILMIFSFGLTITKSFSSMIIVRFLAGLPHGAFFGVGAVVASKLVPKGKEAQAIAMMFSGLTMANIIGVPAGTYIGHHFAWQYTFLIIGVIAILTILAIYLWVPDIEKEAPKRNIKAEFNYFKLKTSWILMAIVAFGVSGMFAWISYIAPLMINVSKFSPDSISYIMILAGLGMFVGNIIGGKMADNMNPTTAIITVLILNIITFIAIFLGAENKIFSLIMTFVAGAVTFTTVAPIQISMIQNAKGYEMLASAMGPAAFNVANSIGAYLGGVPILFGLSYVYPELVGAVLAGVGILLTLIFILIKRKEEKTKA